MVVCPNPFYQIYEGAALLAGAEPYYAPSDPARNFAVDWDSVPAEVWAQHAAAVRLLARQPHRRRDAAGRMEKAVRAVGPPRLRDRLGRVLQRDLLPRRAAAGRAGGGGASWAAPISAGWCAFTSLSKRSNVPGMRSGFVAGDAALHQAVPAVSHLPRQRDEPDRAGGQHRRLERRGARGRQPRPCTARKFAEVTPLLARGAGRAAARRRLLPVGRRARKRHRRSPATCWLNTM